MAHPHDDRTSPILIMYDSYKSYQNERIKQFNKEMSEFVKSLEHGVKHEPESIMEQHSWSPHRGSFTELLKINQAFERADVLFRLGIEEYAPKCLSCNKELTDWKSISEGFGPECRRKHIKKWGIIPNIWLSEGECWYALEDNESFRTSLRHIEREYDELDFLVLLGLPGYHPSYGDIWNALKHGETSVLFLVRNKEPPYDWSEISSMEETSSH